MTRIHAIIPIDHVRASDLDLKEFLAAPEGGGLLRFAGERALLLDAAALGLLRRELIELLGERAARGLLTRFGYAHGWRTAETLRDAFPWDSAREWQVAGGRLHALQGLVLSEPVPHRPEDGPKPFAQAIWKESYEAEQHVLHHGLATEPVCWTLTGFASGYLSCVHGRDVYVREVLCAGKGDAVCRILGRPREEWGDEIAEEVGYYRRECLDEAVRKVTAALRRAERQLRSRRQELALAAGVEEELPLPAGLVARSEPMRRALRTARRVARSDATLLLTGESGSGKERLAQLVHVESARASGPFVALNCGAVAESLLESELFGHAKGAFTGAAQDRPGLFEAAARGTLFLDEIGELSPAVQVRLLRVLQEREVRRVGENRTRPVDVRLVAATNRDLATDVEAGRFRKDLYYRIRVIEIRVPPLRERRDDVLPLARLFLARAAQRTGRSLSGFAPDAASLLLRYPWPGNVRELENAVERAAVLAEGDAVCARDLPDELLGIAPAAPPGAPRTLAEVEKEHVLRVLSDCGGSQARAAAALGIGTATLYRKLRAWGAKSGADAGPRTSSRSRSRA